MGKRCNYAVDGYVLCLRNVIYARSRKVRKGILHFQLSLLRRPDRVRVVRRKTEAKITAVSSIICFVR